MENPFDSSAVEHRQLDPERAHDFADGQIKFWEARGAHFEHILGIKKPTDPMSTANQDAATIASSQTPELHDQRQW